MYLIAYDNCRLTYVRGLRLGFLCDLWEGAKRVNWINWSVINQKRVVLVWRLAGY